MEGHTSTTPSDAHARGRRGAARVPREFKVRKIRMNSSCCPALQNLALVGKKALPPRPALPALPTRFPPTVSSQQPPPWANAPPPWSEKTRVTYGRCVSDRAHALAWRVSCGRYLSAASAPASQSCLSPLRAHILSCSTLSPVRTHILSCSFDAPPAASGQLRGMPQLGQASAFWGIRRRSRSVDLDPSLSASFSNSTLPGPR